MFTLFLSPTRSENDYHVLTPNNIQQTVKSNKCVMVRYFSHHQDSSLRAAADYDLVAQAFQNSSDIYVGGYDCGKYQYDCLDRGIYELPVVELECGKQRIRYDGGFSFESIIDWGRNLTGAQASPIRQLVATPNGKTFKKMIEDNACVFGFFYTPWCQSCKRFMPRLRRIARLYRDVPSIAFAQTDVDRYRSFLRDYDLHVFPEIRLFVRGEKKPIEYQAKRSPAILVEFINQYCGTQKNVSDIESDYGLIDEANSLVEEFYENGKKEVYIQKLRTIPGATSYVEIVENVLENGDDWLIEERDRLNDQLDAASNMGKKEKDALKKKANIISYFLEVQSV